VKLEEVIAKRPTVELTKLAGAVDEEVLADLLGDYLQDLHFYGRPVISYWKLTWEPLQKLLDVRSDQILADDPHADMGDPTQDWNLGDVECKQFWYDVAKKALYSEVEASSKSWSGFSSLGIQFNDAGTIFLKYAGDTGNFHCNVIKDKPPKMTDDDIDLLKILPERLIKHDWQ